MPGKKSLASLTPSPSKAVASTNNPTPRTPSPSSLPPCEQTSKVMAWPCVLTPIGLRANEQSPPYPLCSFARRAMTGNSSHDQPMPCFNKQDGVMPYLLKPIRSPAGPPHGIRFARSPDVAKPEIKQFLANGSGAGPWLGRCSGYGWLLFLCKAGLIFPQG